MSTLEAALTLAAQGLKAFPLAPNPKLPVIDDFTARATTDAATIRQWWICPLMGIEQPFNVGISTQDLCVVDIDNKEGKDGDGTIWRIETLEGLAFPRTRTQITPTGGRHLIYAVPK